MTVEEWKKKNNFRNVGSCYYCLNVLYKDGLYYCTKLNRSTKQKVVLGKDVDDMIELVCDKFDGGD